MTLKLTRLWPSSRRGKIFFLILVLLIASGVSLLIYKKSTENNKKLANPEQSPTTSQYFELDNRTANESIKTKDYQKAVDSLLLASHDATGMGQLEKARNVLQNGLSQIPDKYIPWYAYDALSAIARDLDDKALQKQSLEKAIAKAKLKGSGATQQQIDGLNKILAGVQ